MSTFQRTTERCRLMALPLLSSQVGAQNCNRVGLPQPSGGSGMSTQTLRVQGVAPLADSPWSQLWRPFVRPPAQHIDCGWCQQ